MISAGCSRPKIQVSHRRKYMNKEELQTIIEAMDKGFKADSTATLGDTYSRAKNYIEGVKDVI